MSSENDVIIEAWNTVLFDKFERFKHLLIEGLSSHSDAFFDRNRYEPGARVLDVGCGFGDSALRLRQIVGKDGSVVGVDCAERFVEASRREAQRREVEGVRFITRDVQIEPLDGPYDYVFARFGTMFFSSPGAAMRNLRKSLTPGGRLDMIVWRKRQDNPWLFVAEQTARELVPVVEHDQTDQVHCGPGPFSMAGPDLVSDMLTGVGFDRVSFTRFDTDICIGRDLNEAVEFALALGPAGEILRLAEAAGGKYRDALARGLSDSLRTFQRPDGVWAPSSTWWISARNPA